MLNSEINEYLQSVRDEPIKLLAREVQSWGEVSCAELEEIIASGWLNEFMDCQERRAEIVNEKLVPMWATAIKAAALIVKHSVAIKIIATAIVHLNIFLISFKKNFRVILG